MIRVVLVLVLVLVLDALARAQSTGPTTDAARARMTAGDAAFHANDFATASKEYAAGYAAEPWSGFLFAWAQSERRRGDCVSAVKLYERFNATNPPAEVRQMSDDAIAACGGADQIVPPPRPKPPFQHKLAVGLGAGAIVAGGVAIGFYVASNSAADDAGRAASHPEAVALYDKAQDRRLISQITGGVGVALATAAVIRFVLTDPERPGPQFAIGPSQISFTARW